MDKDKLEFDIDCISDTEYKLRQLSALGGEDIESLDRDNQVLFTAVRRDIDRFDNILVMAPMCWFSSEDDFKHRVSTDLSSYFVDELRELSEYCIKNIGRLIDYMGIYSFDEYVPYNLVDYSSDDLSDDVNTDIPDEIQMRLYRCINTAAFALDILDNPDNIEGILMNLIDRAEMNIGFMSVKTADDMMNSDSPLESNQNNIKEAFVARFRLCKDYDTETGEEDYYNDVEKIYKLYMEM